MVRVMFQIPALNEAATLERVVRACMERGRALVREPSDLSALIVDDGSSDETPCIAARLAASDAHITWMRNDRTRGLGWSFRRGLAHAKSTRADVVVHVDADDQFDLRHLPDLLLPVVDGACDVALGSRFLDPALAPEMAWTHRQGNWVYARLLSMLCHRQFHDVCCGFRAFSRRAVDTLLLRGDFTHTHETILRGVDLGLEILEVPVGVRGRREFGRSRLVSSKLRYGLKSAHIIGQTWLEITARQRMLAPS